MPFSTYLPEHMGSIRLTPSGPFVAGAYAELTLTYTAGTFGIDDTGMVKISWRTTSDMSKPQFDKPAAANFTTVEASNGAKLDVWFDRLNIRPYANTLSVSPRHRRRGRVGQPDDYPGEPCRRSPMRTVSVSPARR
jgi:hypothetical protein